ncbi:Regulatory protein RecX [BD1-7 clade bacterium]|uniref:Regulatory protein RecX n=1 Tax=BD1-7 clade bacterium TaxID=2029982 RepID=A0A5S9N1J4_9GAMM|nr:Regulatory protein RecX [BD1-7 clade bacterium]
MNLLARREHSVKELNRKLRERFPHTEIRQEALLKLTCEGLQSDRRFSENYWRWRAGKGFGPLRIRQELRQRGVDDSDISHGREEAGIDWHAMIYRQFEKKYDGVAPSSIEEKARYVRFFQYRGFSSDLIRELF